MPVNLADHPFCGPSSVSSGFLDLFIAGLFGGGTGFAFGPEVIEFVDLEDIDGVFREPLPRMTLETLPDNGAWLPPFRSLRSLLESRR